jgi:hypothetical protein
MDAVAKVLQLVGQRPAIHARSYLA